MAEGLRGVLIAAIKSDISLTSSFLWKTSSHFPLTAFLCLLTCIFQFCTLT